MNTAFTARFSAARNGPQPFCRAKICSIMGSANASVFPVAVGAEITTSRPARIC